MMQVQYIASVSFGKDSLAMILKLIKLQYPLDKVIFYDTGMEFKAIYDNRDKIKPLLAASNIEFIELHPNKPFIWDMLSRPINTRDGSNKTGYGWCGGPCRWGTTEKNAAIDKYYRQIGGGCCRVYRCCF